MRTGDAANILILLRTNTGNAHSTLDTMLFGSTGCRRTLFRAR